MTDRKAPRTPHGLFSIEGDCQRPQSFGPLDLAEVHPNYQIADMATVDERLAGRGVRLRALIDDVGPGYGTEWLTIENLHGVRECVPLAEIARTGVVVYEQGGKPLALDAGGPARLIVPYYQGAAADVPALSRLVISRERDAGKPSGGAARASGAQASKAGTPG
jgi:DMSO/TMAO reductase YedYZ molybdopterin-dependent catalytic subunit